jgi:uncharacterized repeat protein (TIGR02543 family)
MKKKNTFKLFGAAAVIAVVLFSLASCKEADGGSGGDNDGTTATTYTVTFDANGGSGTVPSAQTVGEGSTMYLPNGDGLTKTGYIFGGWNANSSGTGSNYSAGESYTVTGNVTLYAKWDAAGIQVPGESLAAKLQWLVSNAESGGAYILELNTAYESIEPQTISYTGRSNISVRLRGVGNSARVVQPSSNGSLFTIENGVTLILDDNITLSGRSSNNDSLVRVSSGGTFTMNSGEISGAGNGSVYLSPVNNRSTTFRIVTGTIYASIYAGGGSSLYLHNSETGTITAERGTFSGTTWNKTDDLSSTSEKTIRVVNGELW